jgi:hypothetical protein
MNAGGNEVRSRGVMGGLWAEGKEAERVVGGGVRERLARGIGSVRKWPEGPKVELARSSLWEQGRIRILDTPTLRKG